MSKRITFLEPLLTKIQTLLKEGQKNCLERSITLFGIESDMEALSESIKRRYEADKTKVLLIDLTPLLSLGTQTRLHMLETLSNQVPFVVVAKQGIVFEQIKTLRNIPTIVCDDNHEIILLSGDSRKTSVKIINREFKIGENVFKKHQDWVQNELLEIIPYSVRKPPLGTRYLPLHNGAWANLWIDVKSILRDPDTAFFIAYQIGYLLTGAYSENLKEEGFIVGNNTAYIIASLLNQIFYKKELIIIDRLGPYPNLSKMRLIGIENIGGKKLCMVEDVMSTGRELDMIQLVTYLNNAEISRAVCLFNLDVASSRLVAKEMILSLCNPSRQIGYKRIPKYFQRDK